LWEISSDFNASCENIHYNVENYTGMVQLCLSKKYSVIFTKKINKQKLVSCYVKNTFEYKRVRNDLINKESITDNVVDSGDNEEK